MSLEIPSDRFKMDHEGKVITALMDDPGTYINELGDQPDFATTPLAHVLVDVSERMKRDGLMGMHMCHAFCASGAIAYSGFIESDAPKEMRTRTYRDLCFKYIPPAILKEDSDEAQEAALEVARAGHCSHPEFRSQTEMLVEYFTETTQEGSIGRMAFIGAGFTIYLLDNSWQRTRTLAIEGAGMQLADETEAFLQSLQ